MMVVEGSFRLVLNVLHLFIILRILTIGILGLGLRLDVGGMGISRFRLWIRCKRLSGGYCVRCYVTLVCRQELDLKMTLNFMFMCPHGIF